MKLTGYVHWVKKPWMDAPEFQMWSSDMTGVGPEYVLAGTFEIEWTPPEGFDPRPAQIASLREEKNKVLAAAQVKANNIEEQIQRLQAIEFKGDQP